MLELVCFMARLIMFLTAVLIYLAATEGCSRNHYSHSWKCIIKNDELCNKFNTSPFVPLDASHYEQGWLINDLPFYLANFILSFFICCSFIVEIILKYCKIIKFLKVFLYWNTKQDWFLGRFIFMREHLRRQAQFSI